MAPHMDAILGDPGSPFYLGRAAKVHLMLGRRGLPGPGGPVARAVGVVPYQDHSDALIDEIGDSLRSLPRIFVDLVLPRLPSLGAGSRPGPACWTSAAGRAGRSWSSPSASRRAASTAPTSSRDPSSWQPERIVRHGLADRCSARLLGPDGLTDEARYDVITMFLVVHEIGPEMKDTRPRRGALPRSPRADRSSSSTRPTPRPTWRCGRCRAGSRPSPSGSS